MKKLNHCPFCGSTDLRIPKNFKVKDGFMYAEEVSVNCLYCHASGPTCVFTNDPIAAWNKRYKNADV